MALLAAAGAVLGVLLLARPAAAMPGALDPGFGAGGKAAAHLAGDDAAQAVALTDDGRIVVAGHARSAAGQDAALARFTADGVLDPSFGDGGRALADLGGDDAAYGVAVQSDGAVVVAGTTAAGGGPGADFAVVRLDASGTLDAAFAGRGRARVDFAGGDDHARALALAPDGRVVVAGWTRRGRRTRLALARLTRDGEPDPSFGGAGRVEGGSGASDDRAHAVALQPDGRIVVAGTQGSDLLVARFLADGTPDRTFGRSGSVTIDAGGDDAAHAVAVADGGALVVAGASSTGDGSRAVLARLRGDGARDARFGADGVATFAVAGGPSVARGVVLQRDGRIVVAGFAGRDDSDLVLLRVLPDGSADESFGAGGVVAADFASRGDAAHALVLDPEGRIVVAGSTGGPAALDVLVARFRSRSPACGDGVVDGGEACDAGARPGSCCDARCRVAAEGTACREARGACDVAERCDGESALCPDDVLQRAGAPCRPSAGACDLVDTCSGADASCPADRVRHAGTVCRPAAGGCDRAEECDGTSPACPADAKRRDVCRAARGACDVAEWCDGDGDECPADVTDADGTPCDDGLACTTGDACAGGRCAGERDRFGCAGYLCGTVAGGARTLLRGAPPSARTLLGAAGDVARLSGPRAVCLPGVTARTEAEVDPEVIPDAAEASAAYVVYGLSAAPRAKARRGARAAAAGEDRVDVTAARLASVTVVDQFGTLELAPLRPRRVSAPGAVVRDRGTAAAPAAAAEGHVCYPADVRAGRGAPFDVPLRLEGESTTRTYRLRRMAVLCLPTTALLDALVRGDAGALGDAVVCYHASRVRGARDAAPPGAGVVVADRFAAYRIERLGGQQLCVPGVLAAVELRGARARGDDERRAGKQRKRRARGGKGDGAKRRKATKAPGASEGARRPGA
ncbi:MAG: hypothetical protein AB1689_13385 [Thermodesulfobacteriota bacterium]